MSRLFKSNNQTFKTPKPWQVVPKVQNKQRKARVHRSLDRPSADVTINRGGVEAEENLRERVEFPNVVTKSKIPIKLLLKGYNVSKEQEFLPSSKDLGYSLAERKKIA